ncbi:MAG: DUF5009 domain-containing protein [Muribaculaceae bacterium]|nr:DUF5009 domain-containing protein [Muribaculaceae bacterium]
MKTVANRIESIDVLRGLDLFLLLFLQPVFLAFAANFNTPWLKAVTFQLDHEVWVGFRCWDLVMPLFLFLVGASMPFAFNKYKSSPDKGKLYWKIIRRVIILFLLGMIVQGQLLGFSWQNILIYNNTLQAIAAGYLIASITMLCSKTPGWFVTAFALMVIYSIPMAIYGIYEPGNSFAFNVDKVVLGRFRGDLTYTWIWSSLTFGATVLFGAVSGQIIKTHHNSRRIKTVVLLGCIGAALIILGLAWGLVEPIIKRLWTSSMTMFSAGICMMLLALVYWWIDILGFSYGWNWLKIYGTNSITAYCIGEVINFRSVVNSLTYGLEHLIPEWYPFILTLGNASILFLILYVMHRFKIHLKI